MEKYSFLSKEKNESGREKLLSLEKEGRYLFHGSPFEINILEPRQATNFNKDNKTMEDHGELSVCATQYADVAIFRAIFNKANILSSRGKMISGFGSKDGNLFFEINNNMNEQVKNKTGFVYVLNKDNFNKFTEMEYRSNEKIDPVFVVKVNYEDLPNNIRIIE
jgi:hypothetical protein